MICTIYQVSTMRGYFECQARPWRSTTLETHLSEVGFCTVCVTCVCIIAERTEGQSPSLWSITNVGQCVVGFPYRRGPPGRAEV